MANELTIMRNFFFDRMNADTSFRNQLGGDGIFQRIGQPFLATQSVAYPIVSIRNMGQVGEGVLRILNKGSIVWIRMHYLVVAIKDKAIYPDALATAMNGTADVPGLFELTASLAVTGGVIYHCKLVTPYESALIQDGKTYYERGGLWEIAARAS